MLSILQCVKGNGSIYQQGLHNTSYHPFWNPYAELIYTFSYYIGIFVAHIKSI